jgi:aryl-alcohol dehydrogenase-like predicted oxidoreductase
MKYRTPSRIGKPISIIGFGAWQLRNPEFFGDMELEDAVMLVQNAVKGGINLFDTAPGYGGGNSELTLGIALQRYRDKVFINTKFGHTADGRTDFSVEGLDQSIKESLARLQTDYLDGLILHSPGLELLDGSAEIYTRLQKRKEEGVIRHYGVSIDTLEELEIVLHHNKVDIIELMFNIVHQAPKELFHEVEKQGILLLIKVPLDSGWLTGKYTIDTVHTGIRSRWTKEVINTRLAIVNKVKAILEKDDIVQDSLRFVLSHKAVTSVIPGVRNETQLLSNLAAADGELDPKKVKQLEELYHSFIKDQDTPW